MNFLINLLIATSYVLLLLQVWKRNFLQNFITFLITNRFQIDITAGLPQSVFDSNGPKAVHFEYTNQSRFNNYSTIASHSFNTTNRSNITAATSHGIIEESDRSKRDIRSDILENELRTVVKTYNAEMTSQSKSSVDSILTQSNGLNGLRNLLTFSFNNLATNGLNDVRMRMSLKSTLKSINSFSA